MSERQLRNGTSGSGLLLLRKKAVVVKGCRKLSFIVSEDKRKMRHCSRRLFVTRDVLVYRDAKELSRRDKQAVRGFCIYLNKESDEFYNQLHKQKDHDTHRYHKVLS